MREMVAAPWGPVRGQDENAGRAWRNTLPASDPSMHGVGSKGSGSALPSLAAVSSSSQGPEARRSIPAASRSMCPGFLSPNWV